METPALSSQEPPSANRRPLHSREYQLFQRMAARLAEYRVSPNVISVASVGFAVGAAALLAATAEADGLWVRACWIGAAGMIQLRLLANMLDGMVAMAGQRASPIGELYNDVPDRVSDSAILIGGGYAIGGVPALGYLAATIALFVAYLRAMGAAAGAGQVFAGPMAKPQRMFLLTLASAYCGLAPADWQPIHASSGLGVWGAALAAVIVGGLITACRRLLIISTRLRNRQSS